MMDYIYFYKLQEVMVKRFTDCSHHANTFTVRTDPGRAVANAPLVFLKALLAYLKTTGAAPAELFFFLAAVTAIFAKTSTAIPFFRLTFTHLPISPRIQSR